MSTTQDIVDSLIDHIDKAITKGSVTNQQLAGVLDFLNERYKTLAKAGGSLSKDIRCHLAQDREYKPWGHTQGRNNIRKYLQDDAHQCRVCIFNR